MDIQLTPDQQALIRQAIKSGRLHHEEEAVQEALSLWEERERTRADLIASLDEAEASIDRGEGRIITRESMHDLAVEVKRNLHERLTADKSDALMAHQVAKRAERDLRNIAYYIATESGSIEIAERQIDAIIERFELLAGHPEIGRARDDLGAGRRTFPVENYVILYRVRGKDVLILRVAHSRRNLDTLFRR